MCNHRVEGKWGRIWGRLTAVWLASLVTAEVYGLVTDGPEATYSHFWQRRVGAHEPCRHTPLGRLAIVTFCAWLAAHLGWGKFGVGARRPRVAVPPEELL